MRRHDKKADGKCEIWCKACVRERIKKVYEADEPPGSFDSWVSYATSHQHVGTDCMQCALRKRAMEEHEDLVAKLALALRVIVAAGTYRKAEKTVRHASRQYELDASIKAFEDKLKE